jgi:biuret amidohydrolase
MGHSSGKNDAYFQVQGDPHPWPRAGKIPATACAVLVVDMQHDYCSPGYYIEQAGYDTKRLQAPIQLIRQVLAAARAHGLHVLYTRHGRVGLDESPGPKTAAPGEPGWQIVPELPPQVGETIIEKSTCSAFISGELDRLLRRHGISHLALCGNTIDVCVHSTLRTAVDLGYECLLLADCCGAVNDDLHRWAIESVKVENGVFGTVASAQSFVNGLRMAKG